MREFSAASLSLRRGSSSAAVADCAPEEADTHWGSGWFGTHKTATNQVRLSTAPQRPPSVSKATGKRKGNPEKTQAEGEEGNGAMQQKQPLSLDTSSQCPGSPCCDHLLTRVFSCQPLWVLSGWSGTVSLLAVVLDLGCGDTAGAPGSSPGRQPLSSLRAAGSQSWEI